MGSSLAQEEFDRIAAKNFSHTFYSDHPADTEDYRHDRKVEEADEDTRHLEKMIDNTMRMPVSDHRPYLPHRDFDRGRATGVKGVIADARSYEEARQNESLKMIRSRCQTPDKRESVCSILRDNSEDPDIEDEGFIKAWREQRRLEFQRIGSDLRNRRTSPSVRRYGYFDDVDAMGYLDAIEKVSPDTVVVVFVYDPDCSVTRLVADALQPLVTKYPAVHFVRVHYADIEFDNAGVPALLGYKDQGHLFANLTSVIDFIPEKAQFNTSTLERILKDNKVI